jgi:hypothetical protein
VVLSTTSEEVMKSAVIKFVGAALLTCSIGWATGCDIPDEKKSVFQRAHTTQSDSARPGEQKLDSKSDAKQQKKPHAFVKRDHVDV